MIRIVKALLALILTAALLVGIPAALVFLAGNPIPSWDELVRAMTLPDYSGSFLLGTVLPLVGWIAWATFAIGFLIEIPNQLAELGAAGRSRRPIRIAGLGWQQKAAGVLIATILAVGVAPTAAIAADSPTSSSSSSSSSASATQAAAPQTVVKNLVKKEQVNTLEQRTIVSGDTLWDIAEQELGDGARYPEIHAASQGIEDPDLIFPGQTVNVPTVKTVTTVTQIAVPVGNSNAGAGTVENGGATGSDAGSADGSADSGAAADQGGGAGGAEVAAAAAAGGVGGVLAAGLVGLLAVRRARRRAGSLGASAAPLSAAAVDYERRLEEAADLAGATAIDTVLGHLAAWASQTGAPLPAVYVARADADALTLYLTGPAGLPAPYTRADDAGLVWSIGLGPAGLGELPALGRGLPAPYPALAGIGRDAAGGILFADLERLGSLALVCANETLRESVLTALLLEVALNPWSEQLRVTVVGDDVTVPRELSSRHTRFVDTAADALHGVDALAAAADAGLARLGVPTLSAARVRPGGAEAWAPELMLFSEPLSDAQRAAILNTRARYATAPVSIVVDEAHPGWRMVVDDVSSARLELPGTPVSIPFHPQLLGARERTALAELLAAATVDEGDDLDTLPVSIDSAPTAMAARASDNGDDRPAVLVLGPVQLRGVRGVPPINQATGRPSGTAMAQALELAALLVTWPGQPAERVADLLMPHIEDEATRMALLRTRVNDLRQWMGTADDGTPYVPYAGDGMSLHPDVVTDLTAVAAVSRADGEAVHPAAAEHALAQVRGTPFTGPAGVYGWASATRVDEVLASLSGRAAAAS
ncbi:LysM peptidoglycan-binding domain-containing protein [Microbacterium paludicola]|uniref:LysM peptidoglycan-binding domain-containing protein n=1 Tax=Microbacterium paludicola TaxID=300019 RepID=A0A4Y9FUR8_9MICO|nr:LysM peptidoglycan-binding domain-containing protein [Microbacterium paludicola]MBF0816656.1 LysM peptidoglycan-binding domain-containing protein [Microbacterium paludicola]TFU32636.1 LysM peptidoglycan-binding domain-containing protein [Microbacterium paludicola]